MQYRIDSCFFRGAFLLAAVGLFCGALTAQDSQQGSISGFVYDSSQAVIPGANVTVTSRETGLSRNVTVGGSGVYSVVGLQTGSYDVRASAEGFKTVEQRGILLNIGAKVAINFTLEVGAVTETITVEDVAPVLQTETGEVAHVVSGTQVEELALNGRNFTQFLALGTGVSSRQTGRQMGLGQEGNPLMVIHGGRISMNKYTYDGTLAMDTGGNRGLDIFPPMEAIQEVKVQKSNYGADAGGFGFGVVNIVTRGGGQEFHGSVYEYFRNDKFDARNFFSNDRQVIRSNNFGFTLGGPIYIPGKYNEDKTKSFFFYSQSWARRVGQQINTFTTPPQGVFTATVPTAAMRQGDFSGERAVNDPDSGSPFPNNMVPAARFDPNATLLINQFYPLPNRSGTPNFVHNTAAFTTYREELMRFDHHFTPNVTWTVRHAQDKWFQEQDIKKPGGVLPTFPNRFGKPGKNLTTKLTTVISPTTVNLFTFGYSFNTISNVPRAGERPAGLTIPEAFPANTFNMIPTVAVGQGFATLGTGGFTLNENPIFTWKDDLSIIRGRHNLKFGFELIKHQKGVTSTDNEQGNFNFNGGVTGHSVADFLLGRAFTYTEVEQGIPIGTTAWDDEFYVQDDIKVSSNFTLNLGMRWYVIRGGNGGWADDDNISAFVPSLYDPADAPALRSNGQLESGTGDPLNGIITPASLKGLDELGRDLKVTNKDALGPRFGFAWSPGGGKTVLRGGYGINYFWGTDNNVARRTNPPFSSSVNVQNPLLSDPLGGTGRTFPPNLNSLDVYNKQPTVQSWSFSIQRELMPNTSFEISYVGTRGTHLPRGIQLNQANPDLTGNANLRRPYLGYGRITYRENSAESRYNGLEVSMVRRMSHGFMYELSYTFSKALGHVEGNPVDSRHKTLDWGLTADDRTHIFTYNYVWELPFYKDRGGIGEAILGGWQLSGIATFQSGLPSTITQSGDVAGFGGGTGAQRPNRVGDPHDGRGGSLDRWFNVDAFERQTLRGMVGTEPVFGVRGPGINVFDLALMKNIPLGENARLQLGLETFNIANHPSFDSIGTNSSSGIFGRVLSARDPRVMQLRAKITF